MKVLVVAGTPSYTVPGLGVELKQQAGRSAVDVPTVIGQLTAQDTAEVTLLQTKQGSVIQEDPDAAQYCPQPNKFIDASDMEDLVRKLRYLTSEVSYDCVVSLVQLPPWRFDGLFDTNARFDRLGIDDISVTRVPLETERFTSDPLLKLSDPDTSMLPYIDAVYRLNAERDEKVPIICLEPIMCTNRVPHELIAERQSLLSQNLGTVAVLDDCEADPAKQGAYVVTQYTGAPVHATRLADYIVSAVVNICQDEDDSSDDEPFRRPPSTGDFDDEDVGQVAGSDFYFAFPDVEVFDQECVVVTEKKVWDDEGAWSDTEAADGVVPDSFERLMESVYTYPGSQVAARADLEAIGCVENTGLLDAVPQ